MNLQIREIRQIPRDRRRMPPRMPHRKQRIKQVHQVISLPGQRVSVTSSNSDSKALDFLWEKIISIRFWDKLSVNERAAHSLSNCRACARAFGKEQKSFPLKPVFMIEQAIRV